MRLILSKLSTKQTTTGQDTAWSSQHPLQLAVGMTDNPLGFATWIYDRMVRIVQHYNWAFDEIITWSMMYYIQGPYGGSRFYKEVLGRVFLCSYLSASVVDAFH